jgi:hypothetical protein
MRRRKHGLVVLSIIALALAALVVLAPSLYEVQDQGRDIVPYEAGSVYQVRVLDSVTLYADGESRPEPDKVSGTIIFAAATMMLMAALLLRVAGASLRLQRFFGLAAAGLAFLGVDELFAVHETLGHNLQFLADLPGVTRPDDLVFLLEGLVALGFAWAFRDILLAPGRHKLLFLVGAAFLGLATLGDLAGSGLEEPAEVAAGACLFAGLIVLTGRTLTRELQLREIARPAGSAPGDLYDPDRAGAPQVVATRVADAEAVHRAREHERTMTR